MLILTLLTPLLTLTHADNVFFSLADREKRHTQKTGGLQQHRPRESDEGKPSVTAWLVQRENPA